MDYSLVHDSFPGSMYADGSDALPASEPLPNPFEEMGDKSKPSRRKPKPIQPTPLPPNRM